MADYTIPTLKEPLSESQALDWEIDVRPALRNYHNFAEFRDQLHLHRSHLEQLCSEHLGIPSTDFTLSPTTTWRRGTFNLCAVFDVHSTHRTKHLPHRVLMRFPLPFSAGEDFTPGSVDEKLRCEAATYIHLASECPSVPIPHLLGIGFPGKQSFTAIQNLTLRKWITWHLRRGFAWLHGATLTPFLGFHRDCLPDTGYLLLEYVEDGEMLSYTWQMYRSDGRRRTNLYNSLARIMLDLARQPQPRIGSWTMANDGTIALANRPLFDLACFWNGYRIPTEIPRDMTYTSADTFVHDMLRFQDARMRHQPNAILNRDDGIFQLSSLVALRALIPHFWDRHTRHGPFVMTLADMHQSNIFVDEDWNVTRLIDLEYAPVYPAQLGRLPSWLSGRGVDQLEDDAHLEEYRIQYDELVQALEREELARKLDCSVSQRFREAWTTGRHWHNAALSSINAFPAIYRQHLQPLFYRNFDADDEKVVAQLWDKGVDSFLDKKQKQLDQYEEEIRTIFATARARTTEVKSIGNGSPHSPSGVQNQ